MTQPESYWISLGEHVIGLDVLADLRHARQAHIYGIIVGIVLAKCITEVLDVGCNVCALGHYLRKAGYRGEYVGIDSNAHAIERAFGYFAVFKGNLRLLPLPDETYQCVVVKDVIEHLENIEPLREAFRVARDYAIIATYLPWHDAPTIIERHPDGYYTNTYNRAEVVALAAQCGFGLFSEQNVPEADGRSNLVTLWERQRA